MQLTLLIMYLYEVFVHLHISRMNAKVINIARKLKIINSIVTVMLLIINISQGSNQILQFDIPKIS